MANQACEIRKSKVLRSIHGACPTRSGCTLTYVISSARMKRSHCMKTAKSRIGLSPILRVEPSLPDAVHPMPQLGVKPQAGGLGGAPPSGAALVEGARLHHS